MQTDDALLTAKAGQQFQPMATCLLHLQTGPIECRQWHWTLFVSEYPAGRTLPVGLPVKRYLFILSDVGYRMQKWLDNNKGYKSSMYTASQS